MSIDYPGNPQSAKQVRVVLADANVLYSRVVRDYLLYAAVQGVLEIRWSRKILGEMTKHLISNHPSFDDSSAQRLIRAMNEAFPLAEVALDKTDMDALAWLDLPDEDDRHVIVAAVVSGASVLCTDNLKDFPNDLMVELGVEARIS